MIMGKYSFSKTARLLKSADFERVFNTRCSASDGLIIVYSAPGITEETRLGLNVSRRCGNAVIRNQWKRALREAFRLIQNELPRQLDLVVLPRPSARPDVDRLKASLMNLTTLNANKLAATEAQRDECL